jgi:hypothetical protein
MSEESIVIGMWAVCVGPLLALWLGVAAYHFCLLVAALVDELREWLQAAIARATSKESRHE